MDLLITKLATCSKPTVPVPVPAGIVGQSVEEARAAAVTMGGGVVVKAQVKVGPRGKAGGVKGNRSAEEAIQAAGRILVMDIKGHTVNMVMIAAGAQIEAKCYFSVLLERVIRSYLAMASRQKRCGDRGARRRAVVEQTEHEFVLL